MVDVVMYLLPISPNRMTKAADDKQLAVFSIYKILILNLLGYFGYQASLLRIFWRSLDL